MTRSLTELLDELRSCRWVDLTHGFAPGIPHYAGFPDEQRTVLYDFEEGVGTLGSGFLSHEYRHVGQWGTHIDPPIHFARGGRALDEIGVEEMILPLVVLDVRTQVEDDPDFAADPGAIQEHLDRHGPIPQGAFVALLTGWGSRWPDVERMANRDADGVAHSPGWSVGALRMLVEEHAITAIGHDVTDTDPGQVVSGGQAPAETYILEADRWQLELMANLEELPAQGGLIVASWPKPIGGSGFPARAFAVIPA